MVHLSTMRIIHTSDTHNRHSSVELVECDIFIHTGDFCNMQFRIDPKIERSLNFEQAIDFLHWVDSYPAKHKIICSGNHESFLLEPLLAYKFREKCRQLGIIFKEKVDEVLLIEGIRIGGAGFYPQISPLMPQENAYSNNDNYFSLIPNTKIHILLSHACPRFNINNSYECDILKDFIVDRINYFNPIPLVLCGHIHESRGEYLIKNDTKVINSACVFKPKLINFDPSIKKWN